MADPRGIDRLLDEMAREDAEALLAEARAAARDRVRERLTDDLADRLLEQIADLAPPRRPAPDVRPPKAAPDVPPAAAPEVAPPPVHTDVAPPSAAPETAAGSGVYVYAVVAGGPDADLPPGVANSTVRAVAAAQGTLSALVSDVSLEQFGDEALKRNLNELEWLAATAVAHENVVDAALRATTVVPMRLCTIFRGDDAVREMLARERADLEAALARLEGCHEWGVKVLADADALSDAVAQDSERLRDLRRNMASVGEGAGYFASRELERATREETEAQLARRTHEIHEAVAGLAVDARVNPPSNRDLAGYQGDMVLNGVYLVPHERTEALRALVARLAEEHGEHGLGIELTGPWPPYNFSILAGAL